MRTVHEYLYHDSFILNSLKDNPHLIRYLLFTFIKDVIFVHYISTVFSEVVSEQFVSVVYI